MEPLSTQKIYGEPVTRQPRFEHVFRYADFVDPDTLFTATVDCLKFLFLRIILNPHPYLTGIVAGRFATRLAESRNAQQRLRLDESRGAQQRLTVPLPLGSQSSIFSVDASADSEASGNPCVLFWSYNSNASR